jgi:phage terminase small subunit
MTLPPKQLRFVDEYLIDLNATAAAERAGFHPKMAAKLVAKGSIKAEIERRQAELAERTQITQDKVLKRLWAIATADPNELIEFRRTCCRFCYGSGNRYQRTRAEMERDRKAHAGRKPAEGESPQPFDEAGGIGYDPRKAPNSDCAECFGEGVGTAHPRDTRTVSDAARALYAGVKVTKDGLEVKMHDQQAALVQVGKHIGMFAEKHEHSGPGGSPLEVQLVWKAILADEPLPDPLAARLAGLGAVNGKRADH